MSPPCHTLNKICQLKLDERKKGAWLSKITGKREWSRPQAQRLKTCHHHPFLLEAWAQLCSTCWLSPLLLERAFFRVSVPTNSSRLLSCWLGNPGGKRMLLYTYKLSRRIPIDVAWVSCPHPLTWGEGAGYYDWADMGHVPSCDIIRSICLISGATPGTEFLKPL